MSQITSTDNPRANRAHLGDALHFEDARVQPAPAEERLEHEPPIVQCDIIIFPFALSGTPSLCRCGFDPLQCDISNTMPPIYCRKTASNGNTAPVARPGSGDPGAAVVRSIPGRGHRTSGRHRQRQDTGILAAADGKYRPLG